MTNAIDDNELDAAIRALLVADTTLMGYAPNGVWNGAADEQDNNGVAIVPPFLVFADHTPQSQGQHRYNFGDRRVSTSKMYLVKGVTAGLATELAGTIDKRIDATLHAAALVVPGFTVMVCRRAWDVTYPETDQGRSYRHRGGMYDIQLTTT